MPAKPPIPTHDLAHDFFLLNCIELADPVLFVGHHRHDFYELLWFTSAGDDHLIDFEPYPVRPNQVYFLAPGQVHAVPGQRPTGFALVFSPEFLTSLPEAYLKQLFTPFLNDRIALRAKYVPPCTLCSNCSKSNTLATGTPSCFNPTSRRFTARLPRERGNVSRDGFAGPVRQ